MKLTQTQLLIGSVIIGAGVFYLYKRGNIFAAQSLGFQNAYNTISAKLYDNAPAATPVTQ